MKGKKVVHSRGNDEWGTPQEFMTMLRYRLGEVFALDAAAALPNKKARYCFTEKNSALKNEWITKAQAGSLVWLNPPYSQIKKFVERVEEQVRRYRYSVYMLVPARTDTEWFHRACSSAQNIYFIKGRMYFVHPDGTPSKDAAGFPSCLIVWRGSINGTHKMNHLVKFHPLVLTDEERGMYASKYRQERRRGKHGKGATLSKGR